MVFQKMILVAQPWDALDHRKAPEEGEKRVSGGQGGTERREHAAAPVSGERSGSQSWGLAVCPWDATATSYLGTVKG